MKISSESTALSLAAKLMRIPQDMACISKPLLFVKHAMRVRGTNNIRANIRSPCIRRPDCGILGRLSIAIRKGKANSKLLTGLRCELRSLGLRMVVEGEQSIDMLQSLLVHLSWCHFHLKSSYRLTAYATSLVVNMGLNKRPQLTPQARQHFSS